MRSGEGLWARYGGARRVLCRLSLVAFAAAAGLPGAEVADADSPQPVVVVPGGAPVDIEIAAGGSSRFSVAVPEHTVVIVIVTESQQTSSITWTDGDGRTHQPRTNLAGKDARIRFTLPGAEKPQSFVIAGSSKKRAARVQIVAGIPHAAESGDAVAEDGEEALAEADALWAKHDPANAKLATAAYDRAIAAWDQRNDIPMLRRTLTWKAIYLAFTLGESEDAVPLALRATHLADANDKVEQANAWKSAGFIQTELADYPSGWQDYAKALQLFEKTADLFNQEVLFENRGKLLQMTGDDEGALQDANSALSMAQELHDEVGVLHIEDEIGSIDLLQGKMQAAFEAYSQVLRLQVINAADPMIGFAETDLASLYQELGATAQSQDMQARAEAFWTSHPYRLGQLTTLIQKARLESDAGHLNDAFATHIRSLQLAESAGMKREKVFILLGLGTTCSRQKKFTEARSYFAQAKELAGEIHETDALAQIATANGDLELAEGNAAAAREDYRAAADVARQSFDHADLISALGGLAHAEFKSGNDLDALKSIRQALDGIESVRDSIPPNSLRTGYFSSWHSYYALAIDILMRLDAAHPGDGYGRQALVIAERGRARFLLDQMKESDSRPQSAENRELRAQQTRTLRQIHLAESSLAALRAGHAHPAEVKRLESQVAGLLEREDGVESAMNQNRVGVVRSENLLGSSGELIPELQSRLDRHTAALEYWVNQDASYLWVITANSVHVYRLPGAEKFSRTEKELAHALAAAVSREAATPEAFAVGLVASSRQFNGAAQQLGQWLLPEGALARGIRTLLVVGDGPVLSMPLEALRIESQDGRGFQYVQNRYCVLREPSIAALVALLQRHPASHADAIAVVADPVFNEDDPRMEKVLSPPESAGEKSPRGRAAGEPQPDRFWSEVTAGTHLERLAYSAQEVQAIQQTAGASRVQPVVGFAASAEEIRSMNWSRYGIVHFATHAFLNPVQPDLSNIVLSRFDPSGRRLAGALWFSEIAGLRMPVDLVVLSACQTANGDPLPGEGLVGLSYSFLIAGAHRVVGSLWDVDDAATAELMRRFYQALYGGATSPAEALRSAQRGIAQVPRWSNPYYWAGFTIEGDPHPLSVTSWHAKGLGKSEHRPTDPGRSGATAAGSRREPR